MIHGVEIKKLAPNVDERGYLMEILRTDDPLFTRFAQTYISLNYPGVVRAWHYHKKQNDFFCTVRGMTKIVLYDMREDSPTKGEVQEFFIGEQNPVVLKVPIGVLHGYKTVGDEPSLLLNFPDKLYDRNDPDEYRLPWNSDQVPYDWAIKMR